MVLSLGMLPADKLDEVYHVSLGGDGFVAIPAPNSGPCLTDHPGIFAAGVALGPMDIVDSIVTASAASAAASAYIREYPSQPPAHEQPEWEMEKAYA